MSSKRTVFTLVAPGVVLFLAMVFVPVVMSVYYGMTDWNGIGSYRMIGMENFIRALNDPIFWDSLWHAILLALATVFLQHPVAILLAIVITHCGRWERVFRTIYFIPAVISVVVVAKLWQAVFHPNFGLLNKGLELVGLDAWKHDWLGDPDTAIWAIIVTVMWHGFGYALLLYYAGLQGIPRELFEAGKIDGAGTIQLYTKVVIPLLSPMARVAITIAVITCLKQMEIVFLMTNGGPFDSTQFLGNYLYKTAFSSSLYGYGNALSVLFVIFCLVITVLLNKALKRDVGEF